MTVPILNAPTQGIPLEEFDTQLKKNYTGEGRYSVT